ncbi:MAG: chemotaxis protein MotB, partial [Parasphingorhabdus sp.]
LTADSEISRRTHSLEEEQQRVITLEKQLTLLAEGRAKLTEELESREIRIKSLTEESDRAKSQIDELVSEINLISEQKDLEVRTLQDKVTLIRMNGDVVFGPGSTRLKQAGQDVLDRVASFAERMPDRIISLEGHTDSIPISQDRLDKFPSNWELSAARAASAVRYLENVGIESNRLRLVGYGQNQPVADNVDEDGRRRNRRLEIRLVPQKAFESSE